MRTGEVKYFLTNATTAAVSRVLAVASAVDGGTRLPAASKKPD